MRTQLLEVEGPGPVILIFLQKRIHTGNDESVQAFGAPFTIAA
jgi:hypothetical protein